MEAVFQFCNKYHTSTTEIEWSGNTLTTMPLDAGEQMILLSVTDPQVYQNTKFKSGSITGAISLTDSVKLEDNSSLTFQGLGSAEFPFQGSFENSSFTVKRTLFNSLDYSQATFSRNSLTIDWAEPDYSKGAIVATKITGANTKSLTVSINSSRNYSFRDAAFGEISGDLNLTISFSKESSFENKSSNANAGLVANTVTNGTLALAINAFPGSITIGIDNNQEKENNAGLLVGYLNNASLTLNNAMTPPAAAIQAPEGGAGGIVGRVENSTVSQITLNDNVDLTSVTILGKYTGGVAGYAQNAAFAFGERNTITPPSSLGVKANNILGSGDVSSQYTGGIFGWYVCSDASAYASYDGRGFSFPNPIALHVNTASGEAGALFGHLKLDGCSFTVAGTSESPLNISSKIVVADTTVESAGGLVGALSGASQANTLTVQYANVSVSEVTASKVQYLSGVAGTVEQSAVSVEDVTVTVLQPSATTYFGGLVASLGNNCVLKTGGTVSVSTTADTSGTAITKGGGLVGEAKSASVVCLSGITDLSNVAYTAGGTVGQLVAKQESALIFATGSGNGRENDTWTYQRSNAQARVDDIGNYGQVIRLGGNLSNDLISINTDNSISFKNHGSYGTIGSADDFALHAIAFTANPAFELYNNSATIKTSSVTLTGNIDLSGTGIQGLTRDNGTDQWDGSTNGTGKGVTFNGGNFTLTINTGEIYGKRGNEAASGKGSGQCYRHGYYGLMGKVNSAIVENLTINTTMNIGADVNTYAGAVFGWISGGYSGNGSVNTINNVTLKEGSQINLDGTPPTNNYSHVGGFVGYVAGDETGVTVKESAMHGDISYTDTSDSVILGGILGKDNYSKSIELQFENVTVSGSISTKTTGNAHVGGLVADICASSDTTRNKNGAKMSLKNVVVSSTITTSAATTSGGLLGYYWDNVDVTFDGSGENPYAVTTYSGGKQASLTANGAAVGGLCFAATGRWNMQGKAVDMGSASVYNGGGDLGLLVCHGERQGGTPGAYTDGENEKALYLVMDTNWETAYINKSVQITGMPAIFDEIVAYTARSNKAATNPVYDITQNDAGIISLHTTGDKVNMTYGDRNTYGNRTTYGKTKQTNPYSRYYYNLDKYDLDEKGQNTTWSPGGDVNTPEELLVWSVRKYCAANIREYLPTISKNIITGSLDMDGYSYYPINVGNMDVTISNATITFHNQEIESKEIADPKNKSTLASDAASRTQHFTMHSGLLRSFYTDKDAKKTATLTVNDLTLLGTVGMVESGSGALISGKIYGYDGTKAVKLEMDTLKVDSEEVTKPLSVASFNADYAPLLINSIGSFATLTISGVTAQEQKANAGATSLIGNVGDDKAQSITLSFSKMKLPDKKGRFTKATMLHSFLYASNSSAVYNFIKEEDWTGTTHTYQVTYGREIGGTVEYAASGSNPGQHLYARSTENVSYSGEKFNGEGRDDFSSYLPYVYTAYSEQTGYHEIQVNGSMTDINKGCGTYGDPYQISDAQELVSIANYLATNNASKGWTLSIAVPESGENSPFCSESGEGTVHKTFVYDGSETGKEWVEKIADTSSADPAEGAAEAASETTVPLTLSGQTMLTYLRNAYYQITKDIEVSSFTGFGTQANPFRGVIVGKTGNETITLKGKLPQGFIVYSYGSVVKNLKLDVKGTAAVSFQEIQNNQGYTSVSFFGGVMGCILGGDNIIDNVAVSYTGNTVSLGDERPWLIPVGGYVGVISGGGVIFRGNNTLASVPNSYVNNLDYFYANFYVGRVLQGFAVQEDVSDTNQKLDNSEKNYQICQLDSTKTGDKASISVANDTITLGDAQALLVFSSVTNSGGAGNGAVLPYFTKARTCWNGTTFAATSVGGKVRNASYSNVGKTTVDDIDYQKSLRDDFTAFCQGNTSYLDTHYAGSKLYSVCSTQTNKIELVKTTYDMTTYGNGYRSISPRYLANAVCSEATDFTVESNYQYLNPQISCFNGNGATIKTNIVSREYVDDDHHAIAVGSIFNTVRFTSGAMMKDVTIGGTDGDNNKGIISHEYYEWTNGSCEDATHKNWGNSKQGYQNLTYAQGRGLIAVGGFAGNTTAEKRDIRTVSFQSINTKYLYVKGPFDAGGIVGHTGLRVSSDKNSNPNYNIFSLVGTADIKVVPSFKNCTYQNLEINGGWMVGGYLGFATYTQDAPATGQTSQNDIISISFDDASNSVLGADSTIHCQRA